MAGALSGVFTVAIMTPGERIKVLLQTQDPNNKKYNGPVDVVRKVYASSGLAGMYKGTGATLLRDVPGSYAYFAAYEYFKRTLSDGSGKLNPTATLFAGGMAGVFNWLVSIPADGKTQRLPFCRCLCSSVARSAEVAIAVGTRGHLPAWHSGRLCWCVVVSLPL